MKRRRMYWRSLYVGPDPTFVLPAANYADLRLHLNEYIRLAALQAEKPKPRCSVERDGSFLPTESKLKIAEEQRPHAEQG